MKNFVKVVAASALVLSLGVTSVMAEASSKVTAAVGDTLVVGAVDNQTILSSTIKTANAKDLFIDVSLECGLYTDTTVKSKDMVKDTETAHAIVQVGVYVDDELAAPGLVTFCERQQTLEATLQGEVELCETGETLEVCLTDREEEIRLILETTTANSFNFIYQDLESGTHTVQVRATVSMSGSSVDATASALVGKGSMTIESVRMAKDDVVEL